MCRTFDGKKILGGLKLTWSNGSTDVAGEIDENGDKSDILELEEQTAELGEGEHFEKLELRCGWFIEGVKMSTSGGKVFGPWGGDGGEEKKPHKHIRKGVNPRHVYLDGVRGYVVRVQVGLLHNVTRVYEKMTICRGPRLSTGFLSNGHL